MNKNSKNQMSMYHVTDYDVRMASQSQDKARPCSPPVPGPSSNDGESPAQRRCALTADGILLKLTL